MPRKAKRTVNKEPAHWLCEDAGLLLKELVERVRPPEDARRHFQAAGLEFLKGLRAMVEARIGKRAKAEPKGAKIKVE